MNQYRANHMVGLEDVSELELLEALPEKWVELVGIIPLSTVIDIIDNFGGTNISIPKYYQPNGSKKLRDVIDDKDFKKLIKYFTDMYVYVPTGFQLKTLVRHNKMIRLSDEGLSASEIARCIGVSVRTVYLNRQKHKRDTDISTAC